MATLPPNSPKVNDIGWTELHSPENAIADIVFVHGLQGHPRRTWTWEETPELISQGSRTTGSAPHKRIRKLFSRKRGESSKDDLKQDKHEVYWPLDLLPIDCMDTRILVWGYDSNVSRFFGGPTTQNSIFAHARDLLHALNIKRLDTQGRPLIFVAHSLGGIIVKDVLRRAAAADVGETFLDIFTSTEGIIFLGTPHRGSQTADIGEIMRKIASASGFDTTDQNIRALQVNSTELEVIHELFMKRYDAKTRHFEVREFQEAKGMKGVAYLGLNARVVDPFSSSLSSTEHTQSIDANHMSMCRYPSREDAGYQKVVGELRVFLAKIRTRQNQAAFERNKEVQVLQERAPSQATVGSSTHSLTEIERTCAALLVQNTSDAAEYRSSLPERVEGTCQWILSSLQYRDWKEKKEACLLWISGHPGSGKTILSAYLLEYLSAGEASPTFRNALCYFFCNEKIETQRDGTAILRSLIHQLLLRRRLAIKYVKASYELHGSHLAQNFNELWRLFVAIASDRRVGPVNVIVDAIDECEGDTRKRFLRSIMKLVSNSPPNTGLKSPSIKFVVTSRPLLGRQYTTNILEIDPTDVSVEEDLRMVIRERIEGIVNRTHCKPSTKKYLEDALYSKADRTFLWVSLVLRLLEDEYRASQKRFEKLVRELPPDLTAVYERFLYGISSKYQQFASQLLHFLVGSSRPLTLEEMRVLVALEDHHQTIAALEEDAEPNIRETIEGVLGPLVRIWDSKIHLVHQSLKDFLEDLATQTENPLSKLYGIDQQRANLCMAEACVSFLMLDDFKKDLFNEETSTKNSPISPVSPVVDASEGKSIEEQIWDPFNLAEDTLFKSLEVLEAEACVAINEKYTFFDYAATHWASHLSSCNLISASKLNNSALVLFDATTIRGLNWFRYFWFHDAIQLSCPRDFTPLVAASYFGHTQTVNATLEAALSHASNEAVRALYWASRMGNRDIVELLLRARVNPYIEVVDGQTAMIAAVGSDRLEVVEALLEDEGFISDEKGYLVNYTGKGGRTPLSIATGSGYLEVVKRLLAHPQILPDIPDFDGSTPLFWAINGKHLDVLQMLLTDTRISINHVDRTGRTALSWAASSGELQLVKYLLSMQQIQADSRDQNGRNALSWAAGNGHLETTICLRRSQRVAVSARDNDGRNAISWAAAGGHHEVVKYLIKHDRQGADEQDVDGWTPLAWALFSNTPKTVEVLLSSGLVDINKRDNIRRSALSFAAGYGYVEVVNMMIAIKGVDLNSTDDLGWTPLSMAMANGHTEIVQTLERLSL